MVPRLSVREEGWQGRGVDGRAESRHGPWARG